MGRRKDPAFVTIPGQSDFEANNDGSGWPWKVSNVTSAARPWVAECQSCSQKAISIATLSGQLREANARIVELQDELQQSQQKLLVFLAAENLQQQQLLDLHHGEEVDELEEPFHVESSSSRTGLDDITLVPLEAITQVAAACPSVPNLSCTVNVPELIRHAERGEEAAVVMLLDSGENPNNVDDMGLTALHCAAKKGRRGVVNLLLQRRADPNVGAAAWRGETPLHYASKYGHAEVVKLLLESRSEVNVKSREGRTPLQYAEKKGHQTVEEILRAAVAVQAAH